MNTFAFKFAGCHNVNTRFSHLRPVWLIEMLLSTPIRIVKTKKKYIDVFCLRENFISANYHAITFCIGRLIGQFKIVHPAWAWWKLLTINYNCFSIWIDWRQQRASGRLWIWIYEKGFQIAYGASQIICGRHIESCSIFWAKNWNNHSWWKAEQPNNGTFVGQKWYVADNTSTTIRIYLWNYGIKKNVSLVNKYNRFNVQ